MRTHTNDYKTAIKEFGREIDSKLTYNGNIIGTEQIYNITPILHTELLKSVMKEITIESKVDIPVGSEINYQFGVKTRENDVLYYRDNYDYIDYGNYIVKESEYNEANENYTIKCYDKMLYSMKEYTTLQSAEFPLTIREYVSALCSDLDLDFANENDTFVNYNKVLQTDPYANIKYTYRDIFDDLSEVTASNICINNTDKLEIRYINDTEGNNLFDENYYKNAEYDIDVYKYTKSNIKGNRILYVRAELKSSGTTQSGMYVFLSSTPNPNASDSKKQRIIYNGTVTPSAGAYDFTGANTLYFTFYPTTLTLNNIFDNYNIWVSTNNIDYKPFTYDLINEEYLKDININFGKKYGAINTIVLSRSADSDKIARSIPDDLSDEDKIALTIKDNQIMNDDNREQYIDGILNQLYGLEFYLNDYTSTGITYLEACDRYTISANENTYTCIMFNDEVNITQGLVEQIDTPEPDKSETEYKYITPTDKLERTTSLIVDKVNSRITAQAEEIEIIATNIDKETGDVNAVTTKEKHFTFNDSGLRISAGDNDFNSLSDETGTYYYDGTSKVGEYTKDGSKQKDLALFGAYKYGMDDINDNPMFVGQLYTVGNETGFGHFLNE